MLYVDNASMTTDVVLIFQELIQIFHSAMYDELLWQIETQCKNEIFLTDYCVGNESPEVKMMSIIILGSAA